MSNTSGSITAINLISVLESFQLDLELKANSLPKEVQNEYKKRIQSAVLNALAQIEALKDFERTEGVFYELKTKITNDAHDFLAQSKVFEIGKLSIKQELLSKLSNLDSLDLNLKIPEITARTSTSKVSSDLERAEIAMSMQECMAPVIPIQSKTEALLVLMEMARVINLPFQLFFDSLIKMLDFVQADMERSGGSSAFIMPGCVAPSLFVASPTPQELEAGSKPFHHAMQYIGEWIASKEPQSLKNLAVELSLEHDIPLEKINQFYADVLGLAFIAAPVPIKGIKMGGRAVKTALENPTSKSSRFTLGKLGVEMDKTFLAENPHSFLSRVPLSSDTPLCKIKPYDIPGEGYFDGKIHILNVDGAQSAFITVEMLRGKQGYLSNVFTYLAEKIRETGAERVFITAKFTTTKLPSWLTFLLRNQSSFLQKLEGHTLKGHRIEKMLERRYGIQKVAPDLFYDTYEIPMKNITHFFNLSPLESTVIPDYVFPSASKILGDLEKNPLVNTSYLKEKGILESVAKEFAGTTKAPAGIDAAIMLALSDMGLAEPTLVSITKNLAEALKDCSGLGKASAEEPMFSVFQGISKEELPVGTTAEILAKSRELLEAMKKK